MFKKSVEAKSLQRLSGADRKKLKRTIKERFPQASDADIDVILPAKAEITVAKFANRAHVYGVEGGFPMLFDVDGRGTEIFPTVIMDDPNHLSSQNHYSNNQPDNSSEDLVNLFRNLWSSEVVSIQNHNQGTTIPSGASGCSYSVQNPSPQFSSIQPEGIGLMGQAPILPVRMETQQGRDYHGSTHYFPQQQFNLQSSPYCRGFGLNASMSLVDHHHANGYSFNYPNSYAADPFNNFGLFSPCGNSIAQSNQCMMYPIDPNEVEISRRFGEGSWFRQKLELHDPMLLHELTENEIVCLAKFQEGSQYLQNILQRMDAFGTTKILQAFMGSDIFQLMTDQFGHFVFPKLLDSCNSDQIKQLVVNLVSYKDGLIRASANTHGTRVVQKLIRIVKKTRVSKLIIQALAPGLLDLMIDKTGAHVVRECLNHLSYRHNYAIYEVAVKYCIILATHVEGCGILKTCIDNITDPQRRTLLDTIVEQSIYLAQDPYGNYVVQHVLKKRYPDVTVDICSKLQENYVEFSMQQSASNVVEECIRSDGKVYVFNDLLKSNKLLQVAKDPFGNYVIQRALKTTKGSYPELYNSLVTALQRQPHFQELQFHPNARNVYNLVKGNPISRKKASLG